MSQTRYAAGMQIDGFELKERIYSGNMSALWTVTKPGLDLPLVMKIPKLGYGGDPTAIVGFEMEAMIMPRLSGPHVPRFVAAGDFADQPHLVTEFVAGGSLADHLTDQPMSTDEVVKLGLKVANALQDLHEQHVVHLDLKPNNILFRPSGEAVFIDYGLAHHNQLPDLLAEEFTQPMGTAAYIAPEQLLGARNDPRSDIFALGVLLYRLITGTEPFGNPTSIAGMRRRLYRDPVPPRSINKYCPRWLQEIILTCLEVDPSRRYRTAAQLAFALAHPDQVVPGERGERTRRDGFFTVLARRFRSAGAEARPLPPVAEQLQQGQIIVAAIETRGEAQLLDAVRRTLNGLMTVNAEARLACLAVMKTSRVGMDLNVDQEGRNLHVKALVELKQWAHDLDVAPERLTFHVIEAPEIGAAIVDYARNNNADHVVIGARANSNVRAYLGGLSNSLGPVAAPIASLGPVAQHVVSASPCTVTVVKALARADGD